MKSEMAVHCFILMITLVLLGTEAWGRPFTLASVLSKARTDLPIRNMNNESTIADSKNKSFESKSMTANSDNTIVETKGMIADSNNTIVESKSRISDSNNTIVESKSDRISGINAESDAQLFNATNFTDLEKRRAGRCNDPKSPCSCKTTHVQIKAFKKHVTHHTCDSNTKRETPAGYECQQKGTVLLQQQCCYEERRV